MIKEIQIENFKSIQSLNLELGRLNVFIGANGSGKSNILEGIAFGSASVDNKLKNGLLYAKGVRKTELDLVKSGFSKKNITKDIRIFFKFLEDNFRFNTFINSDNNKLVSKHNFLENSKAILNQIEELQKALNFHSDFEFNDYMAKKSYHKSYLGEFLIFAPENYFLRRFEEDTQIEPLGIRGEGLFSHVVTIFKEKPELFKKINENLRLFDWFDGFEIPSDLMFTERRIKIKDQYLEEGLQYFDQRSANEGFLYLLFYLTLFISDETPKFFAIDNIDNAMNPKLGSQLIKLLAELAQEHDKQVILTTHNPAILDGLNLNDDMQRLFVISRNAEGHTKALRIMKEPIENGKPNVKLSEQFLRGYIGGLNF